VAPQRARPRIAYVRSPRKKSEAKSQLVIFIDAAAVAQVTEDRAPKAVSRAKTIIHPSIAFSLASIFPAPTKFASRLPTAISFGFRHTTVGLDENYSIRVRILLAGTWNYPVFRRFSAAERACRESDSWDTDSEPSRFKACVVAFDRFADGFLC
jgi:hypothetical protein